MSIEIEQLEKLSASIDRLRSERNDCHIRAMKAEAENTTLRLELQRAEQMLRLGAMALLAASQLRQVKA